MHLKGPRQMGPFLSQLSRALLVEIVRLQAFGPGACAWHHRADWDFPLVPPFIIYFYFLSNKI